MTTVIKRGGKRRQAFAPSKIRKAIKGAAREAGFSSARQKKVIEEVGNDVVNFFRKKRVVKSVDIRKSILRRLSTKAKKVAATWKRFERKKNGKF